MLQASFWWFIGLRWPIHSILQDQSIWKCGIHDSMTIPHMVAIMEPKKTAGHVQVRFRSSLAIWHVLVLGFQGVGTLGFGS